MLCKLFNLIMKNLKGKGLFGNRYYVTCTSIF